MTSQRQVFPLQIVLTGALLLSNIYQRFLLVLYPNLCFCLQANPVSACLGLIDLPEWAKCPCRVCLALALFSL